MDVADSGKQHGTASASASAPTEAAEPPDTTGMATRKRTLAERDAELMARLEEHSGDGGAAGLELEDGQAPAMKRGGASCSFFPPTPSTHGLEAVRDNMFRYI
jgi:hypothetical protein